MPTAERVDHFSLSRNRETPSMLREIRGTRRATQRSPVEWPARQ